MSPQIEWLYGLFRVYNAGNLQGFAAPMDAMPIEEKQH